MKKRGRPCLPLWSGVEPDRAYLGTAYPNCWVGSQAVDVIIAHHPMPREPKIPAIVSLYRVNQARMTQLPDRVIRQRPQLWPGGEGVGRVIRAGGVHGAGEDVLVEFVIDAVAGVAAEADAAAEVVLDDQGRAADGGGHAFLLVGILSARAVRYGARHRI